MPLSDDIGEVTKFMLSLVEDPKKLAAYRKDPAAAVKAAKLKPGAANLLRRRGDDLLLVVVVVVVVV